jgi:hypothetical protein
MGWEERYCKRFNEDLKKVEMNSEEKYEITYKFKEQFDYDYFIEAQTEYPKLRRFMEEFESELRSWRKHGSIPKFLEPLELKEEFSNLLSHEVERWYYATKEEWSD